MEPDQLVHWDTKTDSPIWTTTRQEEINISPFIAQIPLEVSTDTDFELLLADIENEDFSPFSDDFQSGLDLFPDYWNSDSRSSEDLTTRNLSNVGSTGILSPIHAVDPTRDNITSIIPGTDERAIHAPARTRFSRESVQVLRKWLLRNHLHPYPNEEEKAILQNQTGLNKTQISNWLANARRRGKVQSHRPTRSYVSKPSTEPMNIPCRPPTPAFGSNGSQMNPLQRWVDSPPEDEPASASAIARAIASGIDKAPHLKAPCGYASTDDSSNHSPRNMSSGNSVGTSSGGSFASSHSHISGHSASSSFMSPFYRHRRRRKRAAPKREGKTSLMVPFKPFQCTFCPETFKTKHDWQRHEKSLHLSLERWICSPEGPTAIDPKTSRVCCVFCSTVDPDEAHLKMHNHSECETKPICEKTFYRKDNLNQHLKIVHGVKFLDWCMKSWKVTMSEVQSRCGFCELIMDTWSMRIDHLAGHFKNGSEMADWKGDWGFNASTLNMVRNAIPPYLVETERNSAFPIRASSTPNESPRNAYELISFELTYFLVNYECNNSGFPRNEEMQVEACRIIFAAEALPSERVSAESSWLRDMLMASEEIYRQARFSPIRQGVENRLCSLRINGKDSLFDQCPLEQELVGFVNAKVRLGLSITDEELQRECCCIISRIEDGAEIPSDVTSNWFVRLITSTTSWLAKFRQRVHLPRSEDNITTCSRPRGAGNMSSAINNHSTLEGSLEKCTNARRGPSGAALQIDARNVTSNCEKCRDETTTGRVACLPANERCDTQKVHAKAGVSSVPSAAFNHASCEHDIMDGLVSVTTPGAENIGLPTRRSRNFESMMKRNFFLNDRNWYRHFTQDLTRFVTSTMSPNNPNRHIPTDAEIQHQARWMMFDSDDPWNQTTADNGEWLQQFKRDVGILPPK